MSAMAPTPKDVPANISSEEFEWIQVQADLDNLRRGETGLAKLKRKFQENPMVPLGCLVTATVLTAGLYSMRTGNKFLSQKLMRYRIFAQGATIVSLIAGVTWNFSSKETKKE